MVSGYPRGMLGIDEYDLSAIIMAIEEELGISIPEIEVEEIINVNDLYQRVHQHQQVAKKGGDTQVKIGNANTPKKSVRQRGIFKKRRQQNGNE